MRTFEYRKNFFFWAVVATMWTLFNIFFYKILYQHTTTVGGWGEYQLYTLVGLYTMFDAIIWSVLSHSMKYYTRDIYSGEFSNLLTKPINTVFLIFTRYNNYNNLPRFVIGVGLTIWSLLQLGAAPTPLSLMLALLAIGLGLIWISAVWLCISTLAFYVEKLDNINEVFPALRRIYSYPASIYTNTLHLVLTTVIPLGLITTLPAETLHGHLSLTSFAWLLVSTLIAVVSAALFFRFSIKRYAGVAN